MKKMWPPIHFNCMRNSIYRLKCTYWQHSEDIKFSHRLCSYSPKAGFARGGFKMVKDTNQNPNFWDLARSSGISKHPMDKPHSQKRKRSRKTHPLAESSSRVNMNVLIPTISPSPKRSDLAKKKAVSYESLGSSASQCKTIVNSDPGSLPPVIIVLPNIMVLPHPSSKPSHPFTFKFITNRIKKCQGCKGSLRIGGKRPTQPYDLIFSHKEYRPFDSRWLC